MAFSLTDGALPKMEFEPSKDLNVTPKKLTTPRTNRPLCSSDVAKFFNVNIPDTKRVKSDELEVANNSGLMIGSAFHGLRKSRKGSGMALTLNELPELHGVCKFADLRKPGVSGKATFASIVASSARSGDLPMPRSETVVFGDVMSSNSSKVSAVYDSDSGSDSESDSESDCSSVPRSVTLVGEEEWAPVLIDTFFQPPSQLGKFESETVCIDSLAEDSSSHTNSHSGRVPSQEFMDNCKKILRSVIPERKKTFSTAKFQSEPMRPQGAPQIGRFVRREVRSISVTDVRPSSARGCRSSKQ
jgi:hypothetical protein